MVTNVNLLKWRTRNGDCPVLHITDRAFDSPSMSRAPWDGSINRVVCFTSEENSTLGPIENKYHEGKMQSTLKRGLYVPVSTVLQASEFLVSHWIG